MFEAAAIAPYVREAMLTQMAPDPASGSPRGPRGAGVGPYAALIGGNAADAITTMQAIRSGRGREGNPLLPRHPGAMAGVKAALTVPQVLAMRHLVKAGHPTAAKALGYGLGALGAGLAVRNARVGR